MPTASTRDYYQVLGVARNASEKEIRQAYRKAARKYHPDVNPGNKQAEAQFKEIQRAYEVLGDPDKRAKYDKYGEAWERIDQQGGFGQGFSREYPGGFEYDFNTGRDSFDLGDIFDRYFGGGSRAGATRRQRKGEDVEYPVEVTLEEAYNGTQRLLQVQAPNAPGKRLEVKVPPGVRDGSRVRVAGEGGPGVAGGANGDLYLVVTVRPHPVFERKGDDLYEDVQVPLLTAILGGEVRIPTLKGDLALKVPPETQNGRVFRLAGQGMPHLGGNVKGDLFAKVRVVLPTELSAREKELFQQLAEMRPAK
ncbi:MAG: J domain-containing protein [Chloroflexi bacterium]|nr:J domain-containing protein [Chloroflexota bacterium]